MAWLERRKHPRNIGLLRDSILGPHLELPTRGLEYTIGYEEAPEGQWIGYDFRRPEEFGRRGLEGQYHSGEAVVLDLEEIKRNPADKLTPTGAHSLLLARNLTQLKPFSRPELIAAGYVVETNYQEVLTRLNLEKRYDEALKEIGTSLVDIVTPKGNGVVYLIEDFKQKRQLLTSKANRTGRRIFPLS